MRPCSVVDCDRLHYAKGYCKSHHEFARITGRTPVHLLGSLPWNGKSRRKPGDHEIRFASKAVPRSSGCIEWAGSRRDEYGVFHVGGRGIVAHRYAYELRNGPIPAGLVVDHLCRNTLCVNPDHLEAVTNRENILRGTSRAAANARKTHCIRGHEFTEANTILDNRGRRCCRSCSPTALVGPGRGELSGDAA